ncbi:MAG: hypothetical protein ACYC96_13185 [Fimbriimonadaceae bacterium]
MTASVGRKRAWSTVAIIVLALYLLWGEVRIRNLEALANLAYDGSACAIPGRTRADVERRLTSMGYKIAHSPDQANVDVISASTLMSLYEYYFIVHYDGSMSI